MGNNYKNQNAVLQLITDLRNNKRLKEEVNLELQLVEEQLYELKAQAAELNNQHSNLDKQLSEELKDWKSEDTCVVREIIDASFRKAMKLWNRISFN